jgi:hypothetical protein
MDKLLAAAAACKGQLPPAPQVTPVVMTTLICDRCGCFFAVPEPLFEIREDERQTIACPNGHRRFYGAARLPKADDAKLIELHRREQAEAKEAEEAGKGRRRKGAA